MRGEEVDGEGVDPGVPGEGAPRRLGSRTEREEASPEGQGGGGTEGGGVDARTGNCKWSSERNNTSQI